MATERQPRTTDIHTNGWPLDEEGKPMVLVTMQASELIGLPSYSNVTVGPASVTRFVREGEVEAGLQQTAHEVEDIVASERVAVLEIVTGAP